VGGQHLLDADKVSEYRFRIQGSVLARFDGDLREDLWLRAVLRRVVARRAAKQTQRHWRVVRAMAPIRYGKTPIQWPWPVSELLNDRAARHLRHTSP
jgi:hypothetical protein